MKEHELTEQPEQDTQADPDLDQQLDNLEKMAAKDFTPPENDASLPAPQNTQEVDIDTGAMCGTLAKLIFSILANRKGKHWALSKEEADDLGPAIAAVLDKYMPGMKGGPEATLIIAVMLIVMPRVQADAEIKREQAKLKAVENDRDNKSPQPPAPQQHGEGNGWIQDKAA